MMLVRPFSPTDMPSIMEIVSRSLGETYPPSLYLTVHNLWRDGFLVLQAEGVLVAFVAAVPSGERVARVLMLGVLPERRRMGYGRRLMSELCSNCIAKGYDTVILEVRKSNKDAIEFYERQGFVLTGQIGSFYSNGEDAYKMCKTLQS
jgi:ribosomal protein S18 acetylase RimI-like enzyme